MRTFIRSNPAALVAALFVAFGVRANARIQLPIPPIQLPHATQVPPIDKLGPLMQQALSDPNGHSRVIIRAVDAASVPIVAALIQQAGLPGRTLSIIQAQAADVPNAALLALAADPAVLRIAADRPTIATDDRTNETIGAAAVRQTYGYDGTGIGIAVIDSGVFAAHADLGDGAGASRVVQFVDFVNGATAPYDDYGHGTHVAGIIAGNGFDSSGARAGVAPGARIVALKVLDASGRGSISDLIAAFDYVLAHKDLYAIRVVNVSIGAGVYESADVDLLTLAAKAVEQAGIVVVAAAGNNGMSGGATQYGGITAPGNAPWVLTVGASNHEGTVDRSDDTVASFSSRGPTAIDAIAKPDVLAPGVGIESLSSPNSTLYHSRPAGLLAGTTDPGYLPYLSLSGTSQATPVVAGSVALMLQANPALTPNAVKAILQYTAQNYSGYDALTQGAGFLNTSGAVTLARYFGGQLAYPDGTGWSWQLIWANHRLTGGLIMPRANGWSNDVEWGAALRGAANVDWGLQLHGLFWTDWGTSCRDLTCSSVTWGSADSENVVWGTSCGGDDCPSGTGWPSPAGSVAMIWNVNDAQTIVWGTSDGEGDTIVWGTSDGEGDTIVWGTTCDPSCHD